jgi:crotonobetainyl-CoA:carnitine CoA-transferase CaiB-like acyl-CoA transferase
VSTPAPLSGIRVIELGSSIAAPYGAWILAELGAEVIKVERPEGGDDARHWGPPFWHGMAAIFRAMNRNKKSVTTDMRNDAEIARLRRLIIDSADVVLQNMRPGKVEALGLDAASLLAEKPSLVYCNIGAFGKVGPLKDRPGYDPLMQAFGGLMSVTGEEGRPPVRVGTSIMDMGTGMWCAIGILAALRDRDRTGEGGVVDTSLYETSVGWMTNLLAQYQASGNVPVRAGSGVRSIAPYQAYECADGYLVVAAGNNKLFGKLAETLGHPEWAEDPRFQFNPVRVTNLQELNGLMGPIFASETRAYWQEKLDAADVPCGPTQSADEVVAHPQTQALNIIQDAPDGEIRLVGLPISFDGVRPPLGHAGPELGADNDDVLGD